MENLLSTEMLNLDVIGRLTRNSIYPSHIYGSFDELF